MELLQSISSLGGNVDTSNLVPYNNATKNVNIGAYYFESSAGFKKTGGTSNQALTADGNVFDLNNIPFLPYNWVFGLGSGLRDTNTAIGSAALSSNTNGAYNTAIGYSALSSNDNGAYNTAIGFRSLSSNDNGRENTAIGWGALSSNDNGLYNTAIGFRAGYGSNSINMIAI